MWKAFILYDHCLFARGLQELLREAGVEVVGVAAKTEAALGQIKNAGPDVIVAEVEKGQCEAEMLLFDLMREVEQARVIRVSLEDGTAACYVGRRCVGNTVEELVKCAFKWMPPGIGEMTDRVRRKGALLKKTNDLGCSAFKEFSPGELLQNANYDKESLGGPKNKREAGRKARKGARSL